MTSSPFLPLPADRDGLVRPRPALPRPRVGAGSDALADALVMDLLSERVPLSLLCDLGLPGGPRSNEICVSEGAPVHAWWAR